MNQEIIITKQELSKYYEPTIKGYSESFKQVIKTESEIIDLIFGIKNEISIDNLLTFASGLENSFISSLIYRIISIREIIHCREIQKNLNIKFVWSLVSKSIRIIPIEYTISSIGSQGFLSIPLFKKENKTNLEVFDFIRLHIWDDSLNEFIDLEKAEDFSIHSHTFFARSWIISGKVINNRYEYETNSKESEHSFFEVVYNDSLNQVNQHSSKAVNKNINTKLYLVSEEIHNSMGYYEIKPSKLHKSGHLNSPNCTATFFSFTGKEGLGESFVIGPKSIKESEINRKVIIDPNNLLNKIDSQLQKE
ncbi:hypothetical protein [uncultured Flavobacterium sp.]|uniref:hypothetical protein n=1 Tax=uncultured Flavobacterium sp. TaxID=165435 RepID=UPI0030C82717